MEKLEPSKFGLGKYDPAEGEANTEYPFLAAETDASSGLEYTVLTSPQQHFDEQRSCNYYNLARDLLIALPALYPIVAGWGIQIPAAV